MTGKTTDRPPISPGHKILFALVLTAVTLGLLEGAARLAPQTWTMDRDHTVRQTVTRDALIASQDVPGWDLSPDGGLMAGLTYTTNRWNMRGPDYDEVAPPDAVRVIFVGDSSIFGFGLAWDDTFSAVFERLREKRQPGVDYQVADCACPGHSTLQSQYKLERQCLAFHPDLVVIGNLNSDSTMAEVEDAGRFHLVRGAPGAALLDHSILFRLVRNTWIKARYKEITLPEEGIPQHGQKAMGDVRRVPVDLYWHNLVRLGETSREAGAQVAYLVLPNKADAMDIEEDVPPEYRHAMRQVAHELDAPLVDGPTRFAGLGRVPRLFLDPVHPGPLGAGILAAQLDEELPLLTPGAQARSAP